MVMNDRSWFRGQCFSFGLGVMISINVNLGEFIVFLTACFWRNKDAYIKEVESCNTVTQYSYS